MKTRVIVALGLLWVSAILMAGERVSREPDKDQPAGDGRVYGKFVVFQPDVAKVGAGQIERVQKIYDEWRKTAAADAHVPREVMLKMYREGDYKTLKTMIENGKISGEHSLSMADVRTAMCLETIGDICSQKIDGKKVKVFRSDSGNQSAGMTSDIDHTLFAYVEDGEGGWKRAPELDEGVARRFKESFEKRHKITLEKFDIATFPGKDKFPDPRRVSVQVDADGKGKLRMQSFSDHAGETMASLRLTPGAYTYCGAVVQQMQLRVVDQLQRELGAKLSAESRPPRKMHPDLKAMVGETDSRVCDAITANEKGEPTVKPATHQEAIDVMFDGLPPALERGHAYDAAVANYLEFMHHLHDKNPAVKYPLRAGDDGAAMLHLLDELKKLGQMDDPHKAKQQYEKLGDAQRKEYLEKIVGRDNPAMVERWKDSFDISARLRELHNAKALSAENVDLAFKPLAEQLAAGKGDWKQYLPAAREEYNRRCQEFLLHNIIATAKERVLTWISYDPNNPAAGNEMDRLVDADRVRKALNLDTAEGMAKWLEMKGEIYKNSADIARLQLLYSFRELPPQTVDVILATAKTKVSPVEYERLVQLRGEAKSITFLYKRVTEYPKLYRDFLFAFTKQNAEMYRQQFVEHLLTQSGLIEPGEQLKVREMFAAHRWPGIGYRYIANATLDPGNIDGVMTVLRAYSESRGDPEAYEHAVRSAVINALPIAGQVVGFVEADSKGKVVMIVCMAIPTAGMTMMVYGIGESGLALYEHEYAAPLANATADAIYRGYVGPSLYEFGQAPAPFTDQDKADLERVSREVENFRDATDKNQQALLAKFKIQETQLAARKNVWTSYVADSSKYEGGVITGGGGHLKQVRLPGESLFDRVEPLVFFSPKGVVDFSIKPLTMAEESQLEALPKLIDMEKDVLVREDLIGQLEVLKTHQEEFQRAERYRQAAKENCELTLQIRRDSLWPYILADKSHDLITQAWVRWWVDDHAADLPGRLKQIGVEIGEKIPERVVQDLQDRVQEDIKSSRARYERWQLFKKAQEKQQQDLVEGRKARYAGEALMEAARQKAKELAPVAEAIFLRNFPDSPPQVFIGLREVPGEKEGEREFRPDVRVVANPDIYRPPYSAACYPVKSNEVAQAVQSRSYQGLPLSKEQIAVLQKSSGPAVLVFAFCNNFELPERLVPETVAGLPRPQKVSVPIPDHGSESLYLLAGSAHLATSAPEQPVEIAAAPPTPPRPATTGNLAIFEAVPRKDGYGDDPGKPLSRLFQGQRFLVRCTTTLPGWRDPAWNTAPYLIKGDDPKAEGDIGNGFGGWQDAQGKTPENKESFVPGTYSKLFWFEPRETGRQRLVARYETLDEKSQTVVHEVASLGLNILPNVMVLTDVTFKDEPGNKRSTVSYSAEKGKVNISMAYEVDNGAGEPKVNHAAQWTLVFPDQLTDGEPATIRYELKPQTGDTQAYFIVDGGPGYPEAGGRKRANLSAEVKSGTGPQTGAAKSLPFSLSYSERQPRRVIFRGTVCIATRHTLTFNVTYTGVPNGGDLPAPAKPAAPATPAKPPSSVGAAPARPVAATVSKPVPVPQKPAASTQSLEQLRHAAETGDAVAQSDLGKRYAAGTGVAKDYAAAVQWFEKSAAQGNPRGQNNLGLCYDRGQGVPQDKARAVELYRKAADQGLAIAQYNLGVVYAHGSGVTKDLQQAFLWYSKAASNGNARAQANIGNLYEQGEGIPQNYAEAVRWYRRAAELGDAVGERSLGLMYDLGRGVKQDDAEAVRWYRIAAEKGDSHAQNNLGNKYAAGKGVPQDPSQAARWYQPAANHGLAQAQYNLGRLCLAGKGVPQNSVQAHAWFNLAAAQGDADAKKAREEIAKKLSAAQIAQAQDLARVLASVSK